MDFLCGYAQSASMWVAWALLIAHWLVLVLVGVCTSLLPCAWALRRGRHVCCRCGKWSIAIGGVAAVAGLCFGMLWTLVL